MMEGWFLSLLICKSSNSSVTMNKEQICALGVHCKLSQCSVDSGLNLIKVSNSTCLTLRLLAQSKVGLTLAWIGRQV